MWHTWNPGKTGDWLQQLDDLCHIHSSFELTKKVTYSIHIHIFLISHKILFLPLGSVYCYYNLVQIYPENSFFIRGCVCVGVEWGEVSSNFNLITSHFMLLAITPTLAFVTNALNLLYTKSRWCMGQPQCRLTYILPLADSYCDYL